MQHRNKLLMSCAIAAISFAGAVHADEASAGGSTIEELVVTAEKRAQSLQDVPVAISAFTDARRELLGINNAQDLVNFSPGLNYNTGNDRITMRGIGRLTNNRSSEGGVAMYNDNFYTSSVYAFASSSLFIDRTEVLRGPQGTLYGRNAIGGAMNIISKRPTDDFSAEVRTTLANYGSQTVEGVVSGPIWGGIRARVGGSYLNQHEGFFKNIAGGPSEGGRGEIWNYEYQLDGKMGDGLMDWWFKGSKSKTDVLGRGAGGRQGVTIGVPNTATALISTGGTTPTSAIANFNRTTPLASSLCNLCFEADTPNAITIDSETYIGHVNFHLPGWDLRYVGGRTWYHYELQTDVDGTANHTPVFVLPGQAGAPGTAGGAGQIVPTGGTNFYPRLVNHYDEEPWWFSNEINFASTFEGPVQILAGVYQYRERSNYTPTNASSPDDARFATPVSPTGGPAPASPSRTYALATSKTLSDSAAVFGQVDWDVTKEWVLHTGLRYTRDKKTVVEGARLICFMGTSAVCPAAVSRGTGMPIDFTSLAVGTGVQIDPSVVGPVTTDPVTGIRSRTLQNSWSGGGGTFGIDWKPQADTMIYAKYSRGYKAGGFNSATTTLSPSVTTKKETIDAYELGAKTTINRQLQVNTSAFFYDYHDLQAVMSTFDPILNANTALYANLPKAQIKGLEVESIWQPIDRLQLVANYSYLDAKVKDGCCFQDPDDPNGLQPGVKVGVRQSTGVVLQDLSGATLGASSPQRVTLNANYNWLLDEGSLSASASYVWRSSTYYSVFNRYYNRAKAWEQVDARLIWSGKERNYTVIGFVKNAFDKRGQLGASGSRLTNIGPNNGVVDIAYAFVQPRTYGIELQYRY